MRVSWRDGAQRLARWLGTGLCAALTLTLLCMAAAVLVQALAVLVLGLFAAALLLPHPLKWYAAQAGEAAGTFFDALTRSFGGKERPERETERSRTGNGQGTGSEGGEHVEG